MAMGNLAKPLDESLTAAGGQQESELTPWPTNTISLAEDYRMVMVKRAVFQSLASMGLPAFTIHSVVKYSGKMVRGSKVAFVRTWVPIGVCFLSFLLPSYSSICFFFKFLVFLGTALANAFDLVYSSVSPLSRSSRTYSITLLKKQWTGHSVPRCAFTAVRMQFVLCLRMR